MLIVGADHLEGGPVHMATTGAIEAERVDRRARGKLLVASEVATLCKADLKTIHNWVNRGHIRCFRTPGRHLRFRGGDVARFLVQWGFAVPAALEAELVRRVVVVGPARAAALVAQALDEGSVAQHLEHPYDALIRAAATPAAAYVIDAAACSPSEADGIFRALHRALPRAVLVGLGFGDVPLSHFVTRAGYDAAALRDVLRAGDGRGEHAE
jgi:hypothetical protein